MCITVTDRSLESLELTPMELIIGEGKSYEERLYCLKLWTLEERRNRQDLIEVFKMCNGLSRLKLNEFFYSSR